MSRSHYLNSALLDRVQSLLKEGFVPAGDPTMAGATSGDPSAGGAPPGGAPPGMDPSMMGGAPPGGGMDPSMMGGAPPGGAAPPPMGASDPAGGPAMPSPDLASRVAALESGGGRGGAGAGPGGKPKLDVGEQLMYLIRQMKTIMTLMGKFAEQVGVKLDPNEMTASLGPSPEDMMNGQTGIGGAPGGMAGPAPAAGGAMPPPAGAAPPTDPSMMGGQPKMASPRLTPEQVRRLGENIDVFKLLLDEG
jgi:hypothetical protein